ncbi:MAG TPA: S41 family peptidase [Vicinamibacteria bacterium]|nr:S41 family peptidase [Vicinamibacteria bacterium]
MPTFVVKDEKVDEMMKKARNHKALVLDLRGNHGGLADLLTRLVGYFFDRDVKLGDVKRRKETKPEKAGSRGPGRVFKGPLVVLIDSESASASEIFARVIQIEKRGTVLGDRSAGAVMESQFHPHLGAGYRPFFFGASITVADLMMSDGRSLERVGVVPDERMLPSAADLAGRRDPVLSRAAEILGGKLDPEKAGTLFPIRVE